MIIFLNFLTSLMSFFLLKFLSLKRLITLTFEVSSAASTAKLQKYPEEITKFFIFII